MKNKLLDLNKIAIIFIIIVSLMFSFIVSQDSHHLDTCHEEHCFECAIIHIAQAIITLAVTVFVYMVSSFLIYYVLSRLHKTTNVFMQKSLVFQKVQQNE